LKNGGNNGPTGAKRRKIELKKEAKNFV